MVYMWVQSPTGPSLWDSLCRRSCSLSRNGFLEMEEWILFIHSSFSLALSAWIL